MHPKTIKSKNKGCGTAPGNLVCPYCIAILLHEQSKRFETNYSENEPNQEGEYVNNNVITFIFIIIESTTSNHKMISTSLLWCTVYHCMVSVQLLSPKSQYMTGRHSFLATVEGMDLKYLLTKGNSHSLSRILDIDFCSR